MRIELDREKRIILLTALRDGYFDTESFFDEGSAKPVKFMTEDEIEAEITRIDRLNYPGTCQRLKNSCCQYHSLYACDIGHVYCVCGLSWFTKRYAQASYANC